MSEHSSQRGPLCAFPYYGGKTQYAPTPNWPFPDGGDQAYWDALMRSLEGRLELVQEPQRDSEEGQQRLIADGGQPQGPEPGTKREYIVFELEDGSTEIGGGPYPPMKAREMHQALHNHVRNGHHSGWDIPEEAVNAKRVPESEFQDVVADA